MKIFFPLIAFVTFEASAAIEFGAEYSLWKKCTHDKDCVLVPSAPPCECGPDAIHKSYVKKYNKKRDDIEAYWKGRRDLPSCEPCRPDMGKLSFMAKCGKSSGQCYVED